MKSLSFLFVALFTGACSVGAQQSATSGNRPNLLLILVDDLGFGDLGCYGARDMRTPHLDQLARQGMRFTNFYANSCVCSPTRAALLTGRFQEMAGVPGVIRTHLNNSWGRLSPKAVLLPAPLKQAGYHSAIIGKWHLGLQSPDTPTERGFDFFHGFLGDMMDDYYTHRRHDINYMRRNKEEIDPKGHATDLFSDWAVAYLKEPKARPFFLYLAYNAPHDPIQPPPDFLDAVTQREREIDPKRAKLVAFIEHMDAGIGRVLAALDESGLAQNTFVAFTSDNGGLLAVGANNGPYRAGKGTMYEGGLRVPLILRWPGKITPGSSSDRVALTMDLFPTLLEAARGSVGHEIEGRSFLNAALGAPQPVAPRDLFFGRREGGSMFKGRTIEAMRRGDWKLLRNYPDGPLELYDLKSDPQETADRSSTHPEKLAELSEALSAQLARYREVPWQPAP